MTDLPEISDEMVEAFDRAYDACPDYDDRGHCCTRAGLAAALAGHVLLPSGGEVSTEWAVRWTPNDAGRAKGYEVEQMPARTREGATARIERLSKYGDGTPQLLRKDTRTFTDGSQYTGPWSPVLSGNAKEERS